MKWHTRVPWVTKLRPEMKPKLVANPNGPGRMLVPTPLLIAEEIRKVRRGRVIAIRALRDRLARRCGADSACPFTTGILMHIVAGATEEQLAAGRRPTAPYWRVVDNEGRLNARWPPGPERQAEHLRGEGREVLRDSRTGDWVVQDFTGS